MNDCSTVTYNGLYSQPFTGDSTTESQYSCAFLSNYTLAPKCCSPNKIHTFPNSCYAWCDLPAKMNDAFDAYTGTGDGVDVLQWMAGCLNSTGEDIGPLWCHAQPHIVRPTSSSTTPSEPTSTFDADAWCKTQDPQSLIAANDPAPACGILPSQSNTLALEACCQPAPVKWSVNHCYEVCGLPRGTEFRGVGNLTYDEALGSFKTCLLEKGNNSASALDGVLCRVNGSALELGKTTFATTKYLTGSSAVLREPNLVVIWISVFLVVAIFRLK